MKSFGRFLLFAAFAVQPPLLAHAESSPAKSAQECNDELNTNKAAIEASGETRQEFFHRCWWQTAPGQPTPIKSAREMWRPGSPNKAPVKKVVGDERSKPHADVKNASKPDVTKPAAEKKRADTKPAETKQIEKKQAEKKKVETKQEANKALVVAPPVGVGVPAAVTAPSGKAAVATPDKVVASPKAAPPSASKVIVPKVSDAKPPKAPEAAKKDTKSKEATAKPLPADAMPPPVKDEKKPKAAAQEKAKENRKAKEKPTSVVLREPVRHRRPARFARPVEPEFVRVVEEPRRRHVVRRASHTVVFDEPRFAPPRRPAPRLATRWVPRPGLPVVCVYAMPDARGRSACVPIDTP